jgi:hypothetical protein
MFTKYRIATFISSVDRLLISFLFSEPVLGGAGFLAQFVKRNEKIKPENKTHLINWLITIFDNFC